MHCLPSSDAPLSYFFTAPPPTDIYTFPYTTLFRSEPRPQVWKKLQSSRQPLRRSAPAGARAHQQRVAHRHAREQPPDRKSTRLNSSHMSISYAVFCLKKKKKQQTRTI